jgi:hypothetical protein
MSDYRNRKYSEFSPTLTDWLREEGGAVTDLTLSLINRAQDWLYQYRAWDELIKVEQRTLSATNSITMPATYGGILLAVFCDTNGDHKPDRYYYKDGAIDSGYRLQNTFAKATGHSVVLQFFSTPPANPYIKYPVVLADFTGSGTEYTFFPSDLLLATAQLIHIQEADLVGNEYKAILDKQATLLRDYEQSHQHQNVELNMRQTDESGEQIANDSIDLDSGSDARYVDDFDNSYDMG